MTKANHKEKRTKKHDGEVGSKRRLLVATLVVALGAAVFVNWYYTKPDAQGVNAGLQVAETTVASTNETQSNLGDAEPVSGRHSLRSSVRHPSESSDKNLSLHFPPR